LGKSGKAHKGKTEMSKQVLIIANESEAGFMLKTILEKFCGDQVVVVTSAQEAFEHIASSPPDLIWFTWYWVSLAPGDPGDASYARVETIGLYRQFKERWPDWHIPVLVASAFGRGVYEPDVKVAGLDGHLYWPVGYQEIIEARNAVLRGEKYWALERPA
jgi:DNA-binding NarL/FixJ family response regulator